VQSRSDLCKSSEKVIRTLTKEYYSLILGDLVARDSFAQSQEF
jgi:hypothetical protein